jgi:hypothetical protein
VPSVPLPPLLPNLPPRLTASPAQAEHPLVVDLIIRFLRYPSSSRLSTEEALKHPWFTELDADEGLVLLLPEGYTCNKADLMQVVRYEYKGKTLSQLLKLLLPS